MVRGDRLAAPVALVYDSGKVTGLSAAPYWIIKDGKKQIWENEPADFYQYAGYTCSLRSSQADGTCSVGYTIGYENAPWLFIQSHQVKEREQMGENCFLLEAGGRLGQEKMRQQALICIENILENCMNPFSKLPYDAVSDGKWSNHGWWFDGMHTPGHSAYLTGQAMYYLLKAYRFEKEKMGCEHEKWLAFVRPVLEKAEQEKNSEYEYPCIFSEKTGAGLGYDAFGGVWCLAAAALLLRQIPIFIPCQVP